MSNTIDETRIEDNDNNEKVVNEQGPPAMPNAMEPNSVRGSCQMKRSGKGSMRKKNPGLIRLIGAPTIDITDARRIARDDQSGGEKPVEAVNEEMCDLESPNVEIMQDGEYLDAANEETFTLDTFESLIRAARTRGKTFLLARVTTVDPENLTRLYFSYYAAHQINRVIFRTQPEEGLLHRMKSRNPLNNMLIVGDVHYFAISPEDFDRAWMLRQLKMEQRQVLRTSSPLTKLGNSETDLRRFVSASGHRRAMSESRQQLANRSTASLPEISQVVERQMQENDEDENSSIPVLYEATYFASDDDFLMRTDIRELFKQNSVNADDYQLFQLNRRGDLPYEMTVLGPDGRPLSHGSNAVPDVRQYGWRTLGGILDGGEHRSMVGGFRLGFLSPLGFWLITVSAVAGVVFITLFFLSYPYQYFAFAGLVGFVVFTLLFFVGWDDIPRQRRVRQP
jgi:hypothetical protein